MAAVLHASIISTVNLSEVHLKLIAKGFSAPLSWSLITGLSCEASPLTIEQGRLTAELYLATRPFGLSLGDRACLALAIQQKARVYTADRAWANLGLGVEIELIR